MAHKHNRRRIRPRHRHMNPSISSHSADRDSFSELLSDSTSLDLPDPGPSSRHGPIISSPVLKSRPSYRSNGLTAQHWHNRYLAWQKRDKAQKDEAAKLEADRCRLFGGEPGDDPALCYRMLEFFGGLDYIDSLA